MTTVSKYFLVATVVLLAACGRQGRVQGPERPGQDLIVLLPEADGTVGRATVSNRAGKVELSSARSSTAVSPKQPPAAVTIMSDSDVRRLFGATVAALPPAPRHFMLFYRFDSEELTDGSRALVQEVLKSVKERRFADVVVLGHTDTMGTKASNFSLGLRRANSVRALLIETGLDPSSITVMSHGEAELLIPTADGVVESRNRRVEITVR
jgi:outer membrane protein OmpA-like peptidoglycan-associated protein